MFDSNPELSNAPIGNGKILSISFLESFCKANKPQMAILCIPKESAKELCDKLVELGIRSFWNFSHFDLNPEYGDEDIVVENVHLGDSLLTLAYKTNNR